MLKKLSAAGLEPQVRPKSVSRKPSETSKSSRLKRGTLVTLARPESQALNFEEILKAVATGQLHKAIEVEPKGAHKKYEGEPSQIRKQNLIELMRIFNENAPDMRAKILKHVQLEFRLGIKETVENELGTWLEHNMAIASKVRFYLPKFTGEPFDIGNALNDQIQLEGKAMLGGGMEFPWPPSPEVLDLSRGRLVKESNRRAAEAGDTD